MPIASETMTALATSVFGVYMLLAANFLPELIGCRFQTVLKSSMAAKHAVCYLLTVFLVIFVNPKFANQHILSAIVISVIVYVWFIMTTRASVPFALASISLLVVVYILNIRASNQQDDAESDYSSKARTERIQLVLVVLAFLITVTGFVLYVYEKYNEYGSSFSWRLFLLGQTSCRNYTPEYAKVKVF
jgi:hypothetical protein